MLTGIYVKNCYMPCGHELSMPENESSEMEKPGA